MLYLVTDLIKKKSGNKPVTFIRRNANKNENIYCNDAVKYNTLVIPDIGECVMLIGKKQ